jgi:hypothetical protein
VSRCILLLIIALLISAPARAAQTYDQPVTGARSPRNANYDISVRLDHRTRTLHGRERIVWRNISAQPTRELQFHLYWNAWRNADSTWLKERLLVGAPPTLRRGDWAATDVTAVHLVRNGAPDRDLTDSIEFISPDDASETDRTVMRVAVPEVAPNATITVDVEWTAKIPHGLARTGFVGNYYFIGQWFPKLGVLEDSGWNTHQFHYATEFYADYGVYDVAITVPQEFVVGGGGSERGFRPNGDGTSTHRFHGEDIHDFAWTASPDYIEYRQAFADASLPRVNMRLLLLPDHQGQQERYFAGAAAALRYYGEWFGPYPYDTLTLVDPAYLSAADGMEYPTLFTGDSRWIAPPGLLRTEATAVHETGHQFFYAIIGSNEFENGWMDEGINTYATARVIDQVFTNSHLERRFFGTFIPWAIRDITQRRETDLNRLPVFREAPEADVPATATFRYWPGTARNITYGKTALWMNTLENELGWVTMQKVMKAYFDRWKFRHPKPEDFFTVVNEVSGRDMTWFFDQVYRSSNTFDYGVQAFTSRREGSGYRTIAVFRRYGEATFPVSLRITFPGGRIYSDRWDGVDRRYVMTSHTPEQAVTAQVDPEHRLLLDINYTNNSRTLAPRAKEASRKWALTWMSWLEDLMLTYGFFA